MTPPAMNAPVTTSASIRPTPPTPNAWNAFGGVWRLTFRRFMTPKQWLVFAGGIALLALLTYANSRTGRSVGYYRWLANFYITFLTPIITFIAAAGTIREDMQSASTDYVLIRPVRRPAFVLFKFISHVACIQIGFLIALTAVMGIGVLREITGLASALPWLLFAQMITVVAFSAFGFLCGALTSKYFILGLAYAGVVEMGIGNIPTQLSRLSMLRQVNNLLYSVLPGVRPPSEAQDALTTVAILVSIAAVMLAATAGWFGIRELASGPSKE